MVNANTNASNTSKEKDGLICINSKLLWPLIVYALTSAPMAGLYIVSNTVRQEERIKSLEEKALNQGAVLERLSRIETNIDFIKQQLDAKR